MQNEAYKITGFAAVMAAVGFLLRWLQGMNIYDEETGLANRTAGVNFALIALCLFTVLMLVFWVWRLRRYKASLSYRALDGKSFVAPVLAILCTVIMVAAGLLMLLHAGEYSSPGLRRVLGLFTVLSGFGPAVLVIDAAKDHKEFLRRLFSVLLVLHACLFLVTVYKENASNPVVWSFCMEILALCASVMAFYYLAGYQYEEPKPWSCLLTVFLGLFFCAVCVIDDHSTADMLLYAALALYQGLCGFILVENLEPKILVGIRQ